MSDEPTTTPNVLRLRWQPDGQRTTINLDVRTWAGDVVQELEEHLGGEPVIAWGRRMGASMSRGFRVTEARAIDVIGLAFLGRAHEVPGTSWRDVARSINPFTLELVDGTVVDDEDEQEPAGKEPDVETPAEQAARQVSPVMAALAERRVAEVGMPAVVLPDAQ